MVPAQLSQGNSPLPLGFVGVRSFDVLGGGDRIVRQPFVVHAIVVRVVVLLVGGTIPLDGAFVDVLIVLLLVGHRCHQRPRECCLSFVALHAVSSLRQ